MFLIAPALLLGALASARLVNVTIDDTRGDERTGRTPQYTSVHLWNARSAADQCTTCGARPDGTQAFDETWHDETTFPGQLPSNVSFTFNGGVLYIYCILANNINVQHKDTRLAFYLDESPQPVQQFHRAPDLAVDGFIYNQLVFKDDTLSDREHTMLVSNWADGDSGSLVLFDYAIYSTEEENPAPPGTDTDPSPTNTQSTPGPSSTNGDRSSSSVNLGAVVGGSVAGAVAAILLLAAIFWSYSRRRRQSYATSAPSISTSMATTRDVETLAANIDPFDAYMRQSDSAWNSPHEKGHPRFAASPGSGVSPSLSTPPSVTTSPPLAASPSRSADESAQFRTELERMREELERVRRIAEPPEYSHSGSSGPHS
ncbi:hypothetical protein AURDEDRAFT_117256 [Auricularia subglabra TFB-10046 SS5]|nr:hypothetical protein AURDEDRAFT_117256 [Auricularia subglabra TFB-10046 SS5]